MNGLEVFLSYAWGGESEKIVNELDNAFKGKGITLICDKRDLRFKGMITEFMQRIGEGRACSNCLKFTEISSLKGGFFQLFWTTRPFMIRKQA